MTGLNGDDSPGTQAALTVEERDGAIVLIIGTTYAALPPQQAIDIGEVLVRYGYSQKTGQDVQAKTILSEKIRNKLFQRVSIVIKNLQERKKQPMFVAQEVVDIVLKEVL